MNRKTIGALALLGAFTIPGSAYAAVSAIATADVNLRAGPSTSYPAVDVVGSGDNVRVYGCLSTRSWCDVAYRGYRGWVSSNYLAYLQGGQRYTGPNFVASVGLPIINFSIGDYWGDYYRDRSFYVDIDRYDRRDLRQDRREIRRDRRDDRRDLRDSRREVRQERRDVRDARRDLREARRDGENIRAERRELRQERRQLERAQRDRRRERRD